MLFPCQLHAFCLSCVRFACVVGRSRGIVNEPCREKKALQDPSEGHHERKRARGRSRTIPVERNALQSHSERPLSSERRSRTISSDPCHTKRAREPFRATPVERAGGGCMLPPRHLPRKKRPRAIPTDPCRSKCSRGSRRWRRALESHLGSLRSAERYMVHTLSGHFCCFLEAFCGFGSSGRGPTLQSETTCAPERP